MKDLKLFENPQMSFSQNQSGILKSPQKIGRIYSRMLQNKLQESTEDLNFHRQSTQLPLNQQNGFANSSPLLSKKFLHHLTAFKQQNSLGNSNCGEISPVTTKSFRINKIYSSELSGPFQRKKTPQLIGKLSKSKLNIEVNQQEPCTKRNKVSKSRSPGHFTSRKQASNLRQRKHIQSIQNQLQKLIFQGPTEQNTQIQRQKIIQQVSSQNQRLIEEVKQKQRYLKSLIQKHRKDIKPFTSQLPVAKKNVQQFKYSYPVTSSKVKNRVISKKTSPYLQKIQQNSKLLQGMLVSPKGVSNTQKQRNSVQKTPVPIVKKSRIIDDAEALLQKSALKISPQVNVSFTIKSPKRQVDQNQIFKAQNYSSHHGQPEYASRVSVYSPEKNLDFNHRKPKYISLLIDPIESQYERYKLESRQPSIDISKMCQYFSRKKSSGFQQSLTEQLSSSQVSLNLSTSISAIKQLLIQSSQTLKLTLLLPSCLLHNKKVTPSTQTSYLHSFIQKVYHELRIKPQIITIKKYNNAMFTGVLLNGSNDSDLQNYFMSVIYHFDQVIYVGKWKEKKGYFKNETNKVQGYKHGIGLEIMYKKKLIDLQNETSEKQQNQVIVFDIYYGQFQNNLRQGYGIKLNLSFKNHQINEELIEIGCWQNNLKHGWVKTYLNSKLIQNAEYEKNIKKTQRHLNIEQINN